MTVNELLKIWKEVLISMQDSNEGITLRKINPNGLHLGIDNANSRRLIVIELNHEDIKKTLLSAPSWKGIKFSKFKFSDRRRGLCLELILKDYSDIFESICYDLVRNSENSSVYETPGIVKSVIAKWKLFFETNKASWLSKSQQKGLYGELCCLILINDKIGPNRAIKSWTGPLNMDQDFSFNSGNLEIKTTSSKEHRKIHVSNEKQLDHTCLDSLYLGVFSLLESKSQGESLKALVKECREIISVDTVATQDFEDLLIMSGYLDSHDIYYENESYSVRGIDFYLIDADFPKIDKIPEGIGDVSYSIMLSSCASFKREQEEVFQNLLN